MNSLNLLAIMPKEIKKWAKPFTDAVLGTLKQIAGVPFQKELAIVSADITDEELEKIKDQIIRTDLFIFILSPEYVSFEQTKGLLQLVKAREMILKANHKIVFSVLRITCKTPSYFLQKPLYDFIGESFNTPSFKSKYVKLIKDIVLAMKTSDKMNKGKTEVLKTEEAEAIPITEEPQSFQAPEPTSLAASEPLPMTTPEPTPMTTPEPPIAPEFNSQANIPTAPEIDEKPILLESEEKIEEESLAETSTNNESQDLEDLDFLEPFNNDAIPTADAIPAAPELDDELTPKPLIQDTEEPEPVEEAVTESPEVREEEPIPEEKQMQEPKLPEESETEEPIIASSTQEIEDDLSDDFDSDFDNDLEDKPEQENVIDISEELEETGFAEFDNEVEQTEDINDLTTEKPVLDEIAEDNTSENLEEKINSEIDMSAEDDILSKNIDEPKREEEAVEHKPVNELNADENWDSFIEDESKSEKKPEPETQNNTPVEDEEEELEPWTGSARTYADPDIKKKTESFEKKKKSKTESLKNGMKPKTRKVRPKRKKRPKLETDADIISGEVSDDGFDVLEELGIDIDNIPEEPVKKEEKKKTDTSIFEQLSDQQDLSLDDDLSFDNELVLDDLEDESVEDDGVGEEFGMSKITLTDDSESKNETKKVEKDIVDELDLGDDLEKIDKPKGPCTVFMNKVPESRYEDAIQMVHEINGMEKSEIESLLSRIVIPVLKDVFPDEAEKALDKIKRAGFNGRIRKT